MTETFMEYREDFELYRDDAAKDIRGIANAPNKAARDELVERAQGNISEAERYLRTLKSQIDKLKSSLDRAKLVANSQQRLNEKPDNLSAAGRTRGANHKLTVCVDVCVCTERKYGPVSKANRPVWNLLNNVERHFTVLLFTDWVTVVAWGICRTGNHLDDAQGIIAETEAIAHNITGNLQQQREQLINVGTNVDETRADAKEAGEHLRSLKRKNFIKIMSLYFIIFGLSVLIIYKLISKFT